MEVLGILLVSMAIAMTGFFAYVNHDINNDNPDKPKTEKSRFLGLF